MKGDEGLDVAPMFVEMEIKVDSLRREAQFVNDIVIASQGSAQGDIIAKERKRL